MAKVIKARPAGKFAHIMPPLIKAFLEEAMRITTAFVIAAGSIVLYMGGRALYDQHTVNTYMTGDEAASALDKFKAERKEICFVRGAKISGTGSYDLKVNALDQKRVVVLRGRKPVVALNLANGQVTEPWSLTKWFEDRDKLDRRNSKLSDVANACDRRVDAASFDQTDPNVIKMTEKNRQVLDAAETVLSDIYGRSNAYVRLFMESGSFYSVGVIFGGIYAGRIDFERGVENFNGEDQRIETDSAAGRIAQVIALEHVKSMAGAPARQTISRVVGQAKESGGTWLRRWEREKELREFRDANPSEAALESCMRSVADNKNPDQVYVNWADGRWNAQNVRINLVYNTPTAQHGMFPKSDAVQSSIWIGFDSASDYRVEMENIVRGPRGENWMFTSLKAGVTDMSAAKDNPDTVERDDEVSRDLLKRYSACARGYMVARAGFVVPHTPK